ncbi:putative HNHc nuclease [Staphylococcus cohnii]|uniref:HNHc nuclease n=1 Tax=Staphylococcus cohnii TaxID=29382 RepID=A0ABT6IZJ8_9STAP|nr:putative HNHc nuclease [Staphylococcus cohnii]MDH5140043.1 putative HNHc nuclease [Staphylococcus cohnii]MDH5157926.1 putative HNHc nuclease [Staphylococcus cohnii]MDH5169647.1 putative HNHc nuclease [Staphylococcus cohnii]
MAKIQNYITQDDGTTTVVIEGVDIDNKTSLLLDNGLEVECDVIVSDPYKITDKQRRKVFAMIRDIFNHYGQPMDYLRYMFQKQLEFLHGYEPISLSNCSRRQASELIELILDFIFTHDIPMNKATSDLMSNDKYFIYKSTINRTCVVCGATNADLAHYQAVGRGRNRNKIDHYGNKVLALCRNHHTEQHQIGMDSFNKKYHLTDSWLDVDEKLNKMLKGVKVD